MRAKTKIDFNNQGGQFITAAHKWEMPVIRLEPTEYKIDSQLIVCEIGLTGAKTIGVGVRQVRSEGKRTGGSVR